MFGHAHRHLHVRLLELGAPSAQPSDSVDTYGEWRERMKQGPFEIALWPELL